MRPCGACSEFIVFNISERAEQRTPFTDMERGAPDVAIRFLVDVGCIPNAESRTNMNR